MNNMTWFRDHGQDLDLWQGDQHLATVAPSGEWHTKDYAQRGTAKDVEAAKAAAVAAVKGTAP